MPSHAGYPVRVAVEGHGYRGVPEQVLDEPGGRITREQDREAPMRLS